MNEQNGITLSYLTTQEDYLFFSLAAQKQQIKKSNMLKARTAGFFLVLCGVGLFAFLGEGLYNKFVWSLLVLAGLFTAFYYDIIQPYITAKQAKSGYSFQKRKMVAQTMTFYEDCLLVQTDRYEAKMPYDMLYRCVEDDKVFLLYTGENEMRFLPKRVLAEPEWISVRTLLENALGERYRKISK